MNSYIKIFSGICLLLTANFCIAQTGSLRGGSSVLNNGTKTITLVPPASFSNYTLTFSGTQSLVDSTRWLMSDESGNLSWNGGPGGLYGNGVAYSPGAPQATATTGNYLFYLQNLNTSSNTNAPGAFLAASVVDDPNSSATGMTINVSNTDALATGVNIFGLCMHSGTLFTNGGSVNTGISVNVSGGGTNYAALFTAGSVGLLTTTPTEALEVSGNIRISGKNGLKITEWTDPGAGAATPGTMGIVTLAAGTKVVKASSVTANSRIFLMSQNGVAATVGTSYISARTAGTSFTITSTSGTDVSDVAWWILEP